MQPNRSQSADWPTIQEYADRRGVSAKTIRRLADRGLIPVYRLRGTRVIRVNAAAADALWDREPATGR
jgi:excisionase family DNA binding protein